MGTDDSIDILNIKRVASASIRGYLYQMLCAALEWVDLAPGEILVCEGDEDFDRILTSGERVSTQVANYQRKLGPNSPKVRDSLAAFLRVFVSRQKSLMTQRFRFVTTAASTRGTGFTKESWAENVRSRFTDYARQHLPDETVWLDRKDAWSEFWDSIQWSFEGDSIDELKRRLAGSPRLRSMASIADLAVYRVLGAVFEASSEENAQLRCLTQEDLNHIMDQAEREVEAWTRAGLGRRLSDVFDELRDLDPLLDDGLRFAWKDKPSSANLLVAGSLVVPFDEKSRSNELATLTEWCDLPDRAAVFLLTGRGGTGKTRLAIEWSNRLRATGWLAGFLRRCRPGSDLTPLYRGSTPRLVVIDYAENRSTELRQVLAALDILRKANEGPVLRVLLLAREVSDWWLDAQRETDLADVIQCQGFERTITDLSVESDVRLSIFNGAITAFAQAEGRLDRPICRPYNVTGRALPL
jgi:hypothetical protein